MAILVQNKFPIDNIGRKAVGVNIPFNAPAVFQSNYLTRDAIRNNLINFFSTNPGERVFNPFFGSGLQSLLFENIDNLTKDSIIKIIRDEANQYFPFVNVEEIQVNFQEDNNTIFITVKYVAQNFGLSDEFNIEL